VIDLQLKCNGDLAVDAHHTVEDCGIALGQPSHSRSWSVDKRDRVSLQNTRLGEGLSERDAAILDGVGARPRPKSPLHFNCKSNHRSFANSVSMWSKRGFGL